MLTLPKMCLCRAESRERALEVWLWELSMWQLRLLSRKRFPRVEVFIPSPLLPMLRLGRLSLTPKAKGGWLGAGGRALFPRLSGHITYLHQPEMLFFQKAFGTSLQWD